MESIDYPEEMERLRAAIERLRLAIRAFVTDQTEANASALEAALNDPDNQP